MIKKRENCLYCGEKMESKTAKKKFCSDKCKVYWHRENPKNKAGVVKNISNNKDINISTNIEKPKKEEMPENLSKSEMLRWFREHE